jgi:hypothetical protein
MAACAIQDLVLVRLVCWLEVNLLNLIKKNQKRRKKEKKKGC